ncbi:RodZ domain-containing protein [Microbulbifer marinus]|uniref:Cytoskeleton protein RodZ n=1 Tax=Microbulbifer marinus TaxID=658218 RepID=A0A1H4A9V5_9GAMM|nr:RodZ domain-containing protein [Microbulbifer marinus]SEA32700.1 cytoskeleton protein RodZ [Microbulbifer marinus]
MTANISEITPERPLESSEQELDNSPGSQLRRAREQAGLSRKELSRRLCMIGNKLELLERDEYDRLPGALYVRGYIRNACKELGIDAEPVLQAYAGYCTAEETSRDIVAHVSRSTVVQERKRSLKGLALLPLLVVGGVFWWMNGRDVAPPAVFAQNPSYDEMAVTAPVAEVQGAVLVGEQQSDADPEQAAEAVNLAGDQASLDASAGEEEFAAAGSVEPAATQVEESELLAEPVVDEPSVEMAAAGEPVVETSAAETPASVVEPAPAVAEAPVSVVEAAAAPTGALQLNFAEEAWVEVKDASGTVLLAKLQAAGSEVELTGQPPFSLMLGNASGTEVRYRGELIESDPVGNRRTRRLTVGE